MTVTFPSEDVAKSAVKIWSIVKSIKVGMLTASDANRVVEGSADRVNSRPMRARFEEHADAIWFIVPRATFSGQTQASQTQTALLTFSNGADGDHVALQGTTAQVDDKVKLKSLWDGHADIRFPKGSADPDATLMQFTPIKAAFWAGGSDTLSFIVNFLEAKMTGDAPVVGEHATVPSAAA